MKNTNNDSAKMKGGVVHHPLCLCTIVRDSDVTPIVTPERSRPTGHNGSGHHAASGLINRIVLHIEDLSIAARRCSVVGVPSGSFRKSERRSAASTPSARRASRYRSSDWEPSAFETRA